MSYLMWVIWIVILVRLFGIEAQLRRIEKLLDRRQ